MSILPTQTTATPVDPRQADAARKRDELERLLHEAAQRAASAAPRGAVAATETALSSLALPAKALGIGMVGLALGLGSRRESLGPTAARDLGMGSSEWERVAEDFGRGAVDELRDLQAQREAGVLEPEEIGQRLESWAEGVARTEATRRWSEAVQATAADVEAEIGEPVVKIWVSRGDARVRTLHRALHGQARPLDRPFWAWPGTGKQLRYPGDGQAPVSETANCRCAVWLSRASEAVGIGPALSTAFR